MGTFHEVGQPIRLTGAPNAVRAINNVAICRMTTMLVRQAVSADDVVATMKSTMMVTLAGAIAPAVLRPLITEQPAYGTLDVSLYTVLVRHLIYISDTCNRPRKPPLCAHSPQDTRAGGGRANCPPATTIAERARDGANRGRGSDAAL